MKRIKYQPQQKLAIATQDGVIFEVYDAIFEVYDAIVMPGLGTWEVTGLGSKRSKVVFTRRASRPSPMVRAILKMLGAS